MHTPLTRSSRVPTPSNVPTLGTPKTRRTYANTIVTLNQPLRGLALQHSVGKLTKTFVDRAKTFVDRAPPPFGGGRPHGPSWGPPTKIWWGRQTRSPVLAPANT